MKNSSPESGVIQTSDPQPLMNEMQGINREVNDLLKNARFKRRGIKQDSPKFYHLATERNRNSELQFFKYSTGENKAYHSPQFE